MQLQIDEVSDISGLLRCEEEWRALADSSDNAELLDTPEWMLTCLEHFWPDHRLAFLLVREAGVLRAIFPLISTEGGCASHRAHLMLPIHNEVRRANLITDLDPEVPLDALLEYLNRQRNRKRITAQLCTESGTAGILPALALKHRMATCIRKSTAAPYVDLPDDWESYLAGRDRKTRQELRRKRNRIEKMPGFRISIIRNIEELDAAMEDLFRIEEKSWKTNWGEPMHATRELRGFYTRLAQRTAARGWLRLLLLYIDQRPVSHLFGVAYKNEFHAIKTSYDSEFSDLSPGTVIVAEAMRLAIREGLKRFDLSGSESGWKSKLATGEREHAYYCLYPKRDLHCLSCTYFHHLLKPLIKRHAPRLVSFRQRLLAASRR